MAPITYRTDRCQPARPVVAERGEPGNAGVSPARTRRHDVPYPLPEDDPTMTARKQPATKRPTRATMHKRTPAVTLTALAATLKRMLDALRTIHEHQHTIYQRIDTMDAKIRAALDAVSTKLDAATATVSAELAEIQALVAAIPGGDPAEVAAAVDAIGARLDALSASVAGMSDTVLPAPPA